MNILRKGFSLAELVVSMVIIGVLASMGLMMTKNYTQRAREVGDEANMEQLRRTQDASQVAQISSDAPQKQTPPLRVTAPVQPTANPIALEKELNTLLGQIRSTTNSTTK